MWTGIAAAGLSAAGSIAGGLLSGGGGGHSAQWYIDRQRENDTINYNRQKEFAQHGIRWKVDDAKAAGLHPLAALGSSSSFYTPSGGLSFGNGTDFTGGKDYSWLADTGQAIGRAIDAKATAEERAKAEAVNDEANNLKLENMRLQNEQIKLDMASQLAQQVAASSRAVRNSALPPSMPSFKTRSDGAVVGTVMPGQGDSTTSSLFESKPAEIVRNDPQTPFAEAGSNPDIMWVRTATGGYAPVRSSASQQAYEDDWLGGIQWNIRNRLAPTFRYDDETLAPPYSYKRDPRNFFRYDPLLGEWREVPTARSVRRRASKVTY